MHLDRRIKLARHVDCRRLMQGMMGHSSTTPVATRGFGTWRVFESQESSICLYQYLPILSVMRNLDMLRRLDMVRVSYPRISLKLGKNIRGAIDGNPYRLSSSHSTPTAKVRWIWSDSMVYLLLWLGCGDGSFSGSVLRLPLNASDLCGENENDLAYIRLTIATLVRRPKTQVLSEAFRMTKVVSWRPGWILNTSPNALDEAESGESGNS